MQVVYHLGAQATDEDRLLKCMLKNKGVLAESGIIVPGPSRYRSLLKETLMTLRGKPAPPEVQEDILDAVADTDDVKRLIFSNPSFISVAPRVLDQHMMYPMAGEKTNWLANLFPDNGCEFHIAVCNPATFIPGLFALSNENDFAGFISGVDPMRLKWSDVIGRIQRANPDVKLTVWCNEDTPLIWPEVLAEITQEPTGARLRGTYNFLASLMSPAGMKRLGQYLASHPPKSTEQRRRIVMAFLEKFALEDELEIEIDLPGWTAQVIDRLTDIYNEDTYKIEKMNDITFIAP